LEWLGRLHRHLAFELVVALTHVQALLRLLVEQEFDRHQHHKAFSHLPQRPMHFEIRANAFKEI